MKTLDILEDLKHQSKGEPIVITSSEEAARFDISIAEYVRVVRELCRSKALTILIEPMGSFYIQVNMLS